MLVLKWLGVAAIVAAVGAGGAFAAGQLTGRDIKDSSLKGIDVGNSSLTGADIRNRSLTPRDFEGSVRGPQGEKGDRGPEGPRGPTGASGSQIVIAEGNTADLPGYYSADASFAACPFGTRAVSGGYDSIDFISVVQNRDAGDRIGWGVIAFSLQNPPGSFKAIAYCAPSDPSVAGKRQDSTLARAAVRKELDDAVARLQRAQARKSFPLPAR
jgi:hypothetical protein